MTDADSKVRCSAWAREVGLSPIATVGSYQGYLLVETPLPWPKDVSEVPRLAELGDQVQSRRLRLQALVPSSPDAGPSDNRLVLHLNRNEEAFGGYRRYESTVGDSGPLSLERLLGADDETPGTDVLVCTHGRRDVCCGSQGTELAIQLAAAGPPPGVQLWRTSHTGGHRFAPTFIVLPAGTAWAFADVELVGQVLDRSVPFASVAGHYRGCVGLPSPEVQVLEREVLTAVGWELLDRPRTGYLTGESTRDGGLVTRIESDGDCWEGVVRPGRTLPVPDCMKPLSDAKKSETEWTVADFHSVA